ncbi:MAG TPA: hypothetical protein VIY56_00470 [Vicinamibacterales bacterium]
MARPSRPADTAQLPSLYQPWVEVLLGGGIPAETEATCGHCAMIPEPGDASRDPAAESPSRLSFDPRVKCCTYVPALPNFLVGRILLDTSPETRPGRASVQARIAAGIGVTPEGLGPPPVFAVLYARGAADTFGQAVDLRCPHYQADSGNCGIWRHRQSVCSTWFCKHDRGAVGQEFWLALRRLLGVVERALAVHCVRTLAPGPAALRLAAERAQEAPALRASDLGGSGSADLAAADRVWGSYARREEAFYVAAAQLVGALTWTDVLRAGGEELHLACDVLHHAYDALVSTALPKALRTGTLHVSSVGADVVEFTSYSGYDPLVVPRVLFDVLHVFDGRPTTRALAAAAGAGVTLDRAVVRKLVDVGALVDAERPSP